ncbi:hypothetical protein ACFORJ_07510 [Corynebacterium hansenii]|uniref:PRTRC system protein E n=1 Tax=Corynebacterium hansenii TaxID=394964 RepID=A0ABV7ZPG8_9CORY|nr:hypothetical protein [Corynebacterium hansenii]WJZ00596.1 hypothetical protein CHAN_09965 [Corynebacterium hansenii]
MKLNPRLNEAVEIFRELGWDEADVADAPTLPLGTEEQRKAALAGLKTGDWGEYGKVDPISYGWISAVDVDRNMLALFALRLGVSARRAESLLSLTDDVALARCVAQRGEAYAAQFIGRVCRSSRRGTEHSLSVYGAAAVRLVCELGLAVPENAEYLKDWAVVALAALTGDVAEVSWPEDRTLPTLEELRPSIDEHWRTALRSGVPMTGPFGKVLSAAVKAGMIERDAGLEQLFVSLDTAVRPGDRKELTSLIVNDFAVTDDELVARADALIPVLSHGEAPIVEGFGPRLIANVADALVGEVALACLYAKTQKALRQVLTALKQRAFPGQASAELLADRLGELAQSRDKATVKLAEAVLASWNVSPEVPSEEPEVAGLWQPTPPLWSVPRFELGEVTPEALTEALRVLLSRGDVDVVDLGEDRFLALAVALANQSVDDTRRALSGVSSSYYWSGPIHYWLADEPVHTSRQEPSPLWDMRVGSVFEHLGQIPCLLSQPSRVDLSIEFDDLVASLEKYAAAGVPVLQADLVMALARLDVTTADANANLPEVAVRLAVGTLLDRDTAEVVAEYLADPFVEIDARSALSAQFDGVGWLDSLGGLSSNLYFEKWIARYFGVFPHWGDALNVRLHRLEPDVASVIARQLARSAKPLGPGGAVNLLAVQRQGRPEHATESALALQEAWEHGLLVPGVADIGYLDWDGELRNIASFVESLRDAADGGMLSVVWPILDDVLVASLKAPRLLAGTAEAAQAMQDYVGEVLAAVASGVAPASACDVPGVRALAARSGSSKAVVAAKAVVRQLPDRAAEPAKPAKPSLDPAQFDQIWPAEAGTKPNVPDGVTYSLRWSSSNTKQTHLQLDMVVPGYPGAVFEINSPTRWLYDIAEEGQAISRRVSQDEPEGKESWLHWDGKALVSDDFRNWRKGTDRRLSRAATELSDALVAVLIAYLAVRADDVYMTRERATERVQRLAEKGAYGSAAVKAAAIGLLPYHEVWSPARVVYVLEKQPELLPFLWPLLSEPLRFAGDQDSVPKWANRVLDVVTLHAGILLEATRRGYVPADAWDGIGALAAKKGSSVALKKARALAADFGRAKSLS